MATSGVYTLGLTLNDLAIESFDLLQIGEDGETLDGDMIRRYRNSANLLLKESQSQGLHLWAQKEGTLFLTVGQAEYDLDTAKVTNSYIETTSTAATTAGAYSIPLTSVTGMSVGDNIGIIQNDNNLFWTTIKSISTLTVNLVAPITLATVSGCKVRTYTSTAVPVSRVTQVRREESGYEIPIKLGSRAEYNGLQNKSETGTPIQAYYDRHDIAGESSGTMKLWNAPSSSVPVINFTYERKIQIFTDAEETIDFPDYAQNYFVYQMAVNMIPKYGCSPARAQFLIAQADMLKNDMLAFDGEMKPIKMKIKRHG